ncbi:pterin-4-alpha-carbinolamine dehydratase isoform X1 [Procambarus clarkii]|uniref:pterin-4-alpha-carbinolamine dehydratase isoform X1 n=1 Tax=Procambarus clarkii TaxID=6728 RepID=UPI001E674F03|nr:pterin-4-alpha-carbinolamine dehydratase-like isoform X1 [Procambarus clarkii]XP_045598132.1 pterin-4-alpha-carbinolamine dehydratase-like isoform X1 [Procambarus clarkii]
MSVVARLVTASVARTLLFTSYSPVCSTPVARSLHGARFTPVFLLTSAREMTTKGKGAQKLTAGERESKLKPLLDDSWTMVDGRDAVKKTFLFKDFNEAWGWMGRVALRSEKMDHHPEWFNVYNKVEVTWSTHDCGGLSSKDINMATFCDDTFKLSSK